MPELRMNSAARGGECMASVWEVFANSEADLGRPEAPTKNGFIALARAGRRVWNAWHAAWPESIPDFKGVDFSRTPVDFRGFVFRTQRTSEYLQPITRSVDFSGAIFGDEVNFAGAQFGMMANFKGAQFGNKVDFRCAQFDTLASFEGARFGDDAMFVCAQFAGALSFGGAQFSDGALFTGVQFGDSTNFVGVRFGNGACFDARSKQQTEYVWRAICVDKADFDLRVRFAEEHYLRSDAFMDVAFSGARFEGSVSFENREFLRKTDFATVPMVIGPHAGLFFRPTPGQRTLFRGIPKFHGCRLHQDTSFDNAQFLSTASSEAARAYRTLKLAMAQQHATREEQRFFRLEMMIEGALAKGTQWALFKLYQVVSGYGFSLIRPFIFWLACILTFGSAHGTLARSSAVDADMDWQRTTLWAQYVLFNAFPLPGFDKMQTELRSQLFGNDGHVILCVITLDILHKVCVFIAIFLAGLALRNLFKMKS